MDEKKKNQDPTAVCQKLISLAKTKTERMENDISCK
jgi:hypothetical protein